MKRIITFVSLLLVIRVVAWAGLESTGFCWKQKRWLSDIEKKTYAVDVINRANVLYINPHAYNKQRLNHYGPYPIVRTYLGLDDMYNKNANSIKIDADGQVSVVINLTYRNGDHNETIPFFDQIGLDNCGNLESASSALKW